jgi:Arc/MetJ-type ribon-helix-helix transcriptional regulator
MESAMTLSVRLPDRVEEELAEYCAKHRVSKSEAVKRALEKLLEEPGAPPDVYKASAAYRGHDKRPGDIARHTKRLLRERFRDRGSLG